jgi:hypothetical protein
MAGDKDIGADVESANGEAGSVGEVDVEGVGLLRRREPKDSTPTWSLGPGDSGGWRSTGMSLLLRLV